MMPPEAAIVPRQQAPVGDDAYIVPNRPFLR